MPFRFETANERWTQRISGDLIQFPGAQQQQQEEPIDRGLQIEFYNRVAQIEKQMKDLYHDPKFQYFPQEELDRINEQAKNFVWNSGIQFTE